MGKTTCAAASGLWLAERHPSRKYLIISTDPAHSLFDSFEIERQRNPSPSPLPLGERVKGEGDNLFLREFDAKAALDHFKKKYGKEIKLIADRGTYFDNADINGFFNLSLPGIDEVMAILEIAELIEKEEYHTVIIDTAPTGHTLQMLRLPALLDKWLGVFDLMEGKHHVLQEHFARRTVEDEADAFLKAMHDRLQKVSRLLCNPIKTEFVVVTVPEEMVIAETERLLKGLRDFGVPTHTIIVNRVLTNASCPVCSSRKSGQRPFLEKIEAKSFYKNILLPLLPSEVNGVDGLKAVASYLAEGSREAGKPFDKAQGRQGSRDLFLASLPPCFLTSQRLSLAGLDQVKFIMVSGKGGVGKTTAASSLAILLSERNRNKRYGLYSIDPAHSLGDCFGKTIGDKGICLYSNLNAYELNAKSLYHQFQSEYQDAVNDLFDKFVGGTSSSSGIDFGYDRELLNELLTLAPPGLDELMALQRVIAELRETDCIILDTAPTGHFVRFLEMPQLVKTWLNAIFELLLKYRGVVHLGDVAEKMIRLSRDIRGVMEVVTDKKRSCVIIVTIPETMAIAETRRLVDSITAHDIKCMGIVVNMVADEHGCGFCAARADSEARWIKEATGLCDRVVIVPYIAGDIRGTEKLAEFGGMIWK